MYIRVTTYGFDEGRIDEALEKMAEYMTSPPEVKGGDVIWTM